MYVAPAAASTHRQPNDADDGEESEIDEPSSNKAFDEEDDDDDDDDDDDEDEDERARRLAAA